MMLEGAEHPPISTCRFIILTSYLLAFSLSQSRYIRNVISKTQMVLSVMKFVSEAGKICNMTGQNSPLSELRNRRVAGKL